MLWPLPEGSQIWKWVERKFYPDTLGAQTKTARTSIVQAVS
ncbi:hypothetical protein D779_2264 [Imhoffiella purpurea]|uniref:Uncharacterized protein n=1 Tax=Imhoffiella purpurea TaxID=1249627 RepID=W9VWB0_9GAMM|nr:hypothetical protein D779_2264 [Imhoffiella purpurea]